jgi:hypothetical protein
MADWSLQPSIHPVRGTLYNNGQYFSVKWKPPFFDKVHLFYYFGMNGLSGLSYPVSDTTSVSFGIGMRSKTIRAIEGSIDQKKADLVWNAGIFYDRNNSLMASVFVSGLTDNLVTLNVYPGFISLGGFSPGVWCTFSRSGKFMFGITTAWLPGIAFGG